MKKILNKIRKVLRGGKPLPHEHGPRALKIAVELQSSKNSCGAGCKCAHEKTTSNAG